MTITSRVNLKSDSTDGSIADQTLFHNIIDSYLHLQDGSAQTITGVLTFTGSAIFNTINASDIDVSSLNANTLSLANITTSGISANSINVTGVVSCDQVFASALNALEVNCNDVNCGLVSCSSISVSGIGAALVNTGRIVASAVSCHGVFNLSGTAVFNVETTAAASAGGAGAIPAAEGYLVCTINGRELLIPYVEKG